MIRGCQLSPRQIITGSGLTIYYLHLIISSVNFHTSIIRSVQLKGDPEKDF